MKIQRALAITATTAVLAGGGTVAATADERPKDRTALMAVEGDPVDVGVADTDAARAIRVGAPVTTVPVTVITGGDIAYMEAGVVAPSDTLVGYGAALESAPGRPRVFKPQVEVLASELTSWGLHDWVFFGESEDGERVATGLALTEVKAHSMLGLAAARNGSSVTVRGSLRAYHSVQDRYVSWTGQAVSVQRRDGDRWVQVAGLRTNAAGNISTSITVPRGTDLRLVVKDAAAIWGAVSTTSRV